MAHNPPSRILYSSHITQLYLPATTSYAARYLYLPTSSASCDETIPNEDVLVLGKLGAAARAQKDVTTCKSNIKFYLSHGYSRDLYGRNASHAETPYTLANVNPFHAMKGAYMEQMREAALAGLNCRAVLYAPGGLRQYDDDQIGSCSNATFHNDPLGCVSDPAQCTGGTAAGSATQALCEAAGTGSTWAANTWTADPLAGIDGADPTFNERTDFLMWGILSSMNLTVNKGAFIEGELNLDGVGRPLMMYDYNDVVSVGGEIGTQAKSDRTEDSGHINFREQESYSASTCTPLVPEFGHLMVGGRVQLNHSWEDQNRTALAPAVYAEMSELDGAGGVPNIYLYGMTNDVASTTVTGWIPTSIKWSFDMPSERIDALGKGQDSSGVASTGIDDYQVEADGAADPDGDFGSTNTKEKVNFISHHRQFSKPPFKSSLTIDGLGIDVFPANFETNPGAYINTIYLGHMIVRLPVDGSIAKGNYLLNGQTKGTARSINQSAGDVAATYSLTLEATDCLFLDRDSWNHATAAAHCVNSACANETTCEDAADACNSGTASTWIPEAIGNTRTQFDPCKIMSQSGGGA
jgi:hypothetical protein